MKESKEIKEAKLVWSREENTSRPINEFRYDYF
jgi:hypothetical protein